MSILEPISKAYLADYQEAFPGKSMSEYAELQKELNKIEATFEVADNDNSGDLELEEVMGLLHKLGITRPKEDLKDSIAKVDDDNTGTLRYREFINLMLMERGIIKDPIDEQTTAKPKGLGGRKRHGALKKKKRGHLKLEAKLKKSKSEIVLTVTILEAKDLLPCDLNGLSDPYVKLYVEPDPNKETKQKTKVVKKSLNPTYNEEFKWKFPGDMDLSERRLHVTIWDWDRITKNDFMGAMSFPLSEIADKKVVTNGWFVLLDEKQGATHFFKSRMDGKAPPAIARQSMRPKKESKGSAAKSPSTLQPDAFAYLKVLGRGSFGKVMLAESKSTKELYAIKVLKKEGVIHDDDIEATMTEKSILSIDGDPKFLCRCVATFQTPANLYFVMELVTGGDLMFHAMKRGSFSEPTSAFYTGEIACGLMFLHERGIIYRDLKLDNVMVDNEGHVKIADFGLCKETGIGAKTATFCGTPNYMAPELVSYRPYNASVDWWSLGVVLYEMLNGRTLFDGEDEEELFNNIQYQPLSFSRVISKPARQLMNGFLTRDPSKRLGAGKSPRKEISSQPFFSGINWEELEARKVKPPFVPRAKDPKSAANFDPEFTDLKPVVTPTDKKIVEKLAAYSFGGFSFVRPEIKF